MNGQEPKPKKRTSVKSLVDDVVNAMTPDQRNALNSDDDLPPQGAPQQPPPAQQLQQAPPVLSHADTQPPPAALNADGQPPAPPAQQPPPPQQSQQPPAADPWAEYEEITYKDDDTGESYAVRAPKSHADKVRNGYARRSIMDRTTSYLNKHREWLEPIATNGQLDGVAPIIQQALTDREYADAMVQALNRRRMGLPFFEQQAPPQTPPPAQQQQQQTSPAIADPIALIENDTELDDWTKARLKHALAPVSQMAHEFAQFRTEITEQRRRAAEQEQQRTQAEQQRAREIEAGNQARLALVRQFPETYGNAQQPVFQRVYDYGVQSGIFQQYGFNPAAVVLAHQAMSNPMGLYGLGRPAVASTAAATLAEADLQGRRLAAEAAAHVAAQTTPGGAAAPQATPEGKQRLTRFRTDAAGRKHPVTARDIADQLAAKGMT